MNTHQLTCKACGKPIEAASANHEMAICECQACYAVFSLLDGGGTPTTVELSKSQVAVPRGIQVDDWGPELRITWRWFTHLHWLHVFVALGWNGWVVLWYFNTIGRLTGLLPGADTPIAESVSLLVGVPMAICGVALIYLLTCRCINKTVIVVSQDELRVHQGPLSFGFAQPVLSASQLKQLYCVKTRSRESTCYDVMAALNSGKTSCLVAGLKQLDQAQFIVQQIEQRLKIRDQRVQGEERA